jgi:hypothetical protein
MLGSEVGCMMTILLLSAAGFIPRDATRKAPAEEELMHVRINPAIPPPMPPCKEWLEGRMVRIHLPTGSWMMEMAGPSSEASLAAATKGIPPGRAPWALLLLVASDSSAAGDPWSRAV